MPSVVLGNTAPIEPVKIDEASDAVTRVPRPDLGNQETIWRIPGDESLANVTRLVTEGWSSHHSDAPPAWVESDDPLVAEILSREFECPIGRPKDWVVGPQEEVEE